MPQAPSNNVDTRLDTFQQALLLHRRGLLSDAEELC